MNGYLTLADGSHRPLHHGFLLGRVAGCDLVIDDTKASRKHARLIVDNGVVEIEDLGSSNGTLLNEKPVTRRVLRDGDRVQIGKTVLVFREGSAPGAASGAAPASPFAAEDDLFGEAVAPAPPAPRPPAPAAVPPPVAKAPAVAPPSPPAPPAKPAAVVEFADEIVEVRRVEPPAAKPAAAAGPAPAPAGGQRVLQFHKQGPGRGGLLGDDLGQMGGGLKVLLVLGALAAGGAIVWLVMRSFG